MGGIRVGQPHFCNFVALPHKQLIISHIYPFLRPTAFFPFRRAPNPP
jgi:hypothetical protein